MAIGCVAASLGLSAGAYALADASHPAGLARAQGMRQAACPPGFWPLRQGCGSVG